MGIVNNIKKATGKAVKDIDDSVIGKIVDPLDALGRQDAKKKRASDEADSDRRSDLNDKTAGDTKDSKSIADKMKDASDDINKATDESVTGKKEEIKKVTDAEAKHGEAMDDASNKIGDAVTEHKGETEKTKKKATDVTDDFIASKDPNELADELRKKQDEVTQGNMDLADKKVENAEKLSQWYEGIATSYEDIGKRYQDAVVGLTNAEQMSMKGQSQQDFAAMSSMASKGATTAMRSGGMNTGAAQSLAMSSMQRSAADAYSSSLDRMANIDEQRRQMQFEIARTASSDERANRGLGASIQGSEIDKTNAALDSKADFAQVGADRNADIGFKGIDSGISKYGQTMSGLQSLQGYDNAIFDGAVKGAGSQADLASAKFSGTINAGNFNSNNYSSILGDQTDARMNELGANTYEDEASIQIRGDTYAGNMALDTQRQAELDKIKAERAAKNGAIIGAVGAVAGGITGGPAGAKAGYEVGSGIGSGMSN